MACEHYPGGGNIFCRYCDLDTIEKYAATPSLPTERATKTLKYESTQVCRLRELIVWIQGEDKRTEAQSIVDSLSRIEKAARARIPNPSTSINSDCKENGCHSARLGFRKCDLLECRRS